MSASSSHSHSAPTTFHSEASVQLNLRSDIALALNLYFKYCHRQPIWCFERDEVSDYSSLPEELMCSVMALTSRFTDNRDRVQLYGKEAKGLIMMRIANGTVDLTTLECLCLLSYSSFLGMY